MTFDEYPTSSRSMAKARCQAISSLLGEMRSVSEPTFEPSIDDSFILSKIIN